MLKNVSFRILFKTIALLVSIFVFWNYTYCIEVPYEAANRLNLDLMQMLIRECRNKISWWSLARSNVIKIRAKTGIFTDINGIADKDIVGKLDSVLCYWLKFAQNKYKHSPDQPIRNCLLLYGPPGNGKTLIACKLAELSGWKLIHCSGSAIVGKYVGTAQKNIKDIFDKVERVLSETQKSGVFIFIDEIDHFVGDNKHKSKFEHRAGAAELWQKLDKYARHPRVIFVAATNHYKKLDATFLDRFNDINKVFIGDPDAVLRQEVLIKSLATIKFNTKINDQQLQTLVAMTDGLSIRKLEGIIGSVTVLAEVEHEGKISWDLIIKVATATVEDHKSALINEKSEEFTQESEEILRRFGILDYLKDLL